MNRADHPTDFDGTKSTNVLRDALHIIGGSKWV